MIPQFVRVAAIDNEQAHLDKIYSALVSAGFWAMPFLYDLGSVKPLPPNPYNGIRIIFTDIHLNDGGMNNMAQQAIAIIACLKKIVCDGPYFLIFWTKFPADAQEVFREIILRSENEELIPPVGFGCIDKGLVLDFEDNPGCLPELLSQLHQAVERCGALLLSISWEERVSQAATRSTCRLFDLAHQQSSGDSLNTWHELLAYLSMEAVGESQAFKAPVAAMDAALLPILEDRLHISAENIAGLNNLLGAQFGKGQCSVSKSSLNAHYLISVLGKETEVLPSNRGVVSVIDIKSWDINCLELWGASCSEVISREFFLPGQQCDGKVLNSLLPCVVTLTPECDDVQGKVVSFRYLLGVLIPYSSDLRSLFYSKSKKQYSNLSIFDVGVLSIDVGSGLQDYCLLVSCNRFFAKPTTDLLHVKPTLRLRRATLEELSHHYATHARRPGVMRFSVY
ncbi:hypothetical protein K5D51_01405 [Pseudomonas cichorii]|nr:hypothetical protein [Pseudomonas cichorii]MBX8538336.1 hypothetical protein [Pseudomonas cichorii]MBX8578230.1 hypothetical protein [Pseudomonas cichorii]MBX8603841.1 hypothetical protein [Pseudomonas cichorii]